MFFFRFGLSRRWKDKKKLSEGQFKAPFHFLNRRDTFVCLATGDEKTLIYHTAVLVARKVKMLPSNSLVVVVSPLNALTADQRHESCQRLKLKAVEMERELFDNDDSLKELKNVEVLYRSPETLENIRSKKFFSRMDNRLIGIVVEKSHCVVSW